MGRLAAVQQSLNDMRTMDLFNRATQQLAHLVQKLDESITEMNKYVVIEPKHLEGMSEALGKRVESAVSATDPRKDVSDTVASTKAAVADLRAEIADMAVLLAKEIKTNRDMTQAIDIPKADYSQIHDEFDRMYQTLANLSIDVPHQQVVQGVSEPQPQAWTFDVKRKRSGLIDKIVATRG